jgi:hypothetical protein
LSELRKTERLFEPRSGEGGARESTALFSYQRATECPAAHMLYVLPRFHLAVLKKEPP